MDIDGLGEKQVAMLQERGLLDRRRLLPAGEEQLMELEGFGEVSRSNLLAAIEASKERLRARAWKPTAERGRTASAMRVLSISRTETNTVPLRGTRVPPPIWLFAKATSNERSIPMTSPVDRISGPSTVSTPGNLANGNTDSLTPTWPSLGFFKLKSASFSPAISRAAIFATGMPITLATNGTVRDARGLTSST